MNIFPIAAVITLLVIGIVIYANATATDWRTASRDSAGLAPLPAQEPDAIVQVYAARAINWRGWFAVHTWIATKERGADHYTVYDVMGWQLRRTGTSVRIETNIPDRRWFGAMPHLVAELKGEQAQIAIPKIDKAAKDYPYAGSYRLWPGPNSNTFTSYILRRTPEIGVELPAHAIGRDWLVGGKIVSTSETGTGYQLSLYGLLGITAGLRDGLEVNILGLSFGIDVLRPALKLPFIGRVGIADAAVFKR